MRIDSCVSCKQFPCTDVLREAYHVPGIDVKPERISLVMISEAAPPNAGDNYYSRGRPEYASSTLTMFQEAGAKVSSIKDMFGLGIYLTTAVKCAKTAYAVSTATVRNCSILLEKELSLFPNLRVLMLMGDVAIRALNAIAQRNAGERVIPAMSTYKIRAQRFEYRGIRVIPSYLQVGPSVGIEKSKRRMIGEDIRIALASLS